MPVREVLPAFRVTGRVSSEGLCQCNVMRRNLPCIAGIVLGSVPPGPTSYVCMYATGIMWDVGCGMWNVECGIRLHDLYILLMMRVS